MIKQHTRKLQTKIGITIIDIIVFLNMTLYTYKLINTNTIYTKLTLM